MLKIISHSELLSLLASVYKNFTEATTSNTKIQNLMEKFTTSQIPHTHKNKNSGHTMQTFNKMNKL